MLQKIVIQCKYSGENKASYNWGSLFHGVIMEMLPAEIAEEIHESQMKPFSQFITPSGEDQLEWLIGLWDEYISEHIVKAVMPMTKIELKHKELVLNITDIKRSSISENDYFGLFFTGDNPSRRYEIEFKTPCTHKQYGAYATFPSVDLIIQNLIRRFSAFTQEFSLDAPEAMEQIIDNIRIVRYSLRTAIYYMEQTRITGYVGRITVAISGPEQLARLTGAILVFAEYSGIGIKTALGMGGVTIRPLN